jgi:hypothetical protein
VAQEVEVLPLEEKHTKKGTISPDNQLNGTVFMVHHRNNTISPM